MAELILHVDRGGGGTYEDGDVLVALNDRRIRCTHAQHICHYQHMGFNPHGLRHANSLQRQFLDAVYQYTFERVSEYEVRRTETDYLGNIVAQEVFGKESIDVPEYIKRRKRHPRHRIFGVTGSEVWHGGRTDYSSAAVDFVWDKIKSRSNHRDTPGPCSHCGQDHTLWTMGRLDIRHFLCFQVIDFTEAEASAFVSPHEGRWAPGETITDSDGTAVSPTWSVDGTWQHPTGKWVYRKDERGNVEVTFRKRNIKTDWRDTVLGRIERTSNEVIAPSVAVGREDQLVDLDRAPWQKGRNGEPDRPNVYKVLDHSPINDPGLLRNKKENRRGRRL